MAWHPPDDGAPGGWTLRAVGITRRYGATVANDAVSLDLHSGEIHAVLGENGAGKSTIMKILYGMELPDAGHIELDGNRLGLDTPRDAIRAGIGMVHQHFTLVSTLTVAENLLLGTRLAGWVRVRRRPALARLAALAQRYRIEVDLAARVDTLSVGAQQRVEILKALIGGARALILDEPTAVLAPQETAALFTTLRELAARGWGIFIVTHKLTDAMQLTDRVTVMRQGRRVGTWPTAAISAEALVSHMIAGTAADGAEAASMPAAQAPAAAVRGEAVLELREVRCVGNHGRPGLRGLTLTVHAGEIVGVAGIEGNGQRELAEIITGLRHIVAGSASYGGTPISRQSTAALLRNGIAHVPEDRHRDGVVLDFSIAENAALVAHAAPPLRRRGLLDHGRARAFAERLIRDYDIRCTGPRAKLRSLSGGNQQKLVLGRELARVPRLLVAAQPTRGLDVGAIDYVHRRLLNGRAAGMAVLLISAELDEILALSDRIAVLREGRIVGVLDRAAADAEAVGRLMLAPTAAAA